MYGKHFSTMYEGSMVGSGCHVFAVWGYCISNADPDAHTVRLNPKLLATILGESESRVQDAITFLCTADPDSQCTEHEGRRLLNTSGMEYLVVSHHHYREIKNGSDRREYMRKYMKNYRGKSDSVNSESLQSLQKLNPVSVSASDKEGSQEGGFTLADCVKAAGPIGMTGDQVSKFFHHYNAIGWVYPGNRKISNLSSALAKWKADAPSFGKGKYNQPDDDEIRRKEKARDEADRKLREECLK